MFSCAAEKGHPDAMYALGLCYRDSDGVDGDSEKVVAEAVNMLRAPMLIYMSACRHSLCFGRQLKVDIAMLNL